MLQFIQKRRSSAPEAEIRLKNGASPKSLMSRQYFFKITGFAIICVLLLAGCGGAGKSPSSVVKEAFDAAILKDVDTFSKYVYNLSKRQESNMRWAVENFPFVKFEIENERIFDNGEKAEVIYKGFREEAGKGETEEIPLVKTTSGWMISGEWYDY